MKKKVAILQSSYLPWKGYFDIIHDVDEFIFYDDVQYTKNDWRNRNRIKTDRGLQWLTIPAGANRNHLIYEVKLKDHSWQKKHWQTICLFYSKSPFFKKYQNLFQDVYLGREWSNLSELNQYLIRIIAVECLGICTKLQDSRAYKVSGKKNERLLNLLNEAGACQYVSGPAAKSYIDETSFEAEGIELIYKDYSDYPEYPQFFPPFNQYVTVLDLIFHVGPDASYFIWGWREDPRVALSLKG